MAANRVVVRRGSLAMSACALQHELAGEFLHSTATHRSRMIRCCRLPDGADVFGRLREDAVELAPDRRGLACHIG